MSEKQLSVLARLNLRLPGRLDSHRVARSIVLASLGRWRHGHLTLRLPEGEVARFGDDAAAERVTAQVHDDAFFSRVLLGGEVGAGEAYMDGLWDADDLPALLRLFVRNIDRDAVRFDTPLARLGQLAGLVAHRLRRNTRAGSQHNIQAHYDLGNDFYRLWLDDTMAYSCAWFASHADSLETAQWRKFERIADKLRLGPEDHLLEIGSGWGGFAIHVARTRGCRVTTVTISHEQLRLARERVASAGLAAQVEVAFCDYRELAARYPAGSFDKIASIEMFEAVGHAYFGAFFAACAQLLAPHGLMLLQTIAMPDQRYARYRRNVDWTQKYIFPGACIPALGAMVGALGRASDLVVWSVEDIGPHYVHTLREWRRRFRAHDAEVRGLGFDDRFVRMWELYFGFSEAAFAERTLGDLQLVLTHAGNRALPEYA